MPRTYLGGSQFTMCNDQDVLKCLLKITELTSRLTRWRLRWYKLKWGVVHCNGKKHQVFGALSQFQAMEIDKSTIDDEVTVLCISTSFPQYEKIRDLCIWRLTPNWFPKNIWGTPVRNKAISTDIEHGKGLVKENKFIYEQLKDSNCWQASCKFVLPASTVKYDRNRLLVCTSPIDGAVQKIVPTSL